jgi:hypothetical protein
MMLKLKIIFILGVVGQIYGIDENSEKHPTLILQAVCWDRFTSKNVVYYPWGNQDDNNASKAFVDIGFSSPSYPFVYYGNSPIKLYEHSQPSIEESYREEEKESELKEIGSFPFSTGEGRVQRFLLLLINQKNENKLKIYPLSLAQENIPYGAFNCYSQHKENIYLAYGSQKQTLSPGKSVRFKYSKTQTDSPEMKVYAQKEGKFVELMNEYLTVNQNRRGIVFFSPYKNRLKMKRYFFQRTSLESAIGYDISPLTVPLDINQDDNSTQEQ